MKHLLATAVAIAAMALASCSGSKSSDADSQQPATVITVDDILASPEAYVDSTVTFEGVCTHTCKHGATKMFVMGSDDSKMLRVEACDLGSFDTKVINRPVTVEGTVREQRIDEPFLAQWEQQLADNTAEKHGDSEEGGCATEKAAHGVKASTTADVIAEYRQRIAERRDRDGKPYLSFYYVDAKSYKIEE